MEITALTVQKIYFYSTVFWGAKSGKDEKLNRLDNMQNILNTQADQPLFFFALSWLLLGYRTGSKVAAFPERCPDLVFDFT